MKRNFRLLGILLSVFAFVPGVLAAGEEAKIGETPYTTFEEAVAVADENDVIVLQKDVDLASTWVISGGKSYTVDLNGHTISRSSEVINVNGGSLILTGEGTIKENTPDTAGVRVVGSDNVADNNYSYLKVGKDVTIEGWAPVFIAPKKVAGVYLAYAYGVKVDVSGSLVAYSDSYGTTGSGIYVNGNIKNVTNYPVVNVLDGATIEADDTGIYQAGHSFITVGKASITATGSGIGIKAGKLVLNGPTVKATGPASEPSSYNNGINTVGAAIQIESSIGYAGNMDIQINGGTYESVNNSTIVEYLASATSSQEATTETEVEAIEITDGTFVAKEGEDVFATSDNFKTENTEFINGGTFSSDVKEFLKDGVETVVDKTTGKVTVLKRHNINVSDVENGKVTLDKENALAGETVTITTEANKDYTLKEIVVVDANGNPVEVKDGKFVMPDSETTVKITFVAAKAEAINPDTSDINVLALVSILTLGVAGLGFTLKKRFN